MRSPLLSELTASQLVVILYWLTQQAQPDSSSYKYVMDIYLITTYNVIVITSPAVWKFNPACVLRISYVQQKIHTILVIKTIPPISTKRTTTFDLLVICFIEASERYLLLHYACQACRQDWSRGSQGRIQDFKLGGGAHIKKLRRAEGYSVWKITILRKKIIFFPILGDRLWIWQTWNLDYNNLNSTDILTWTVHRCFKWRTEKREWLLTSCVF